MKSIVNIAELVKINLSWKRGIGQLVNIYLGKLHSNFTLYLSQGPANTDQAYGEQNRPR